MNQESRAVKLTKALIEKAQYPSQHNGRYVLWDEDLSGFGLRIYPSGKKAFVLSYRIHKRKHMFTLGAYGRFTLDEARKSARIRIGDIEKGEDPLVQKRKILNLGTVEELCERYIEDRKKEGKKTWSESKRMIAKDILPSIGSFPVKSLTFQDVDALHGKIGARSKYGANRAIEVLHAAIEKGRNWGFIDRMAVNPAGQITRYAELKRDRWVTQEELPRVAAAIDEHKCVYVRSAFWLYLYTGVRKSELLKAKWSDINFFRKELRLGETKNGEVHYVPLSAPAIDIIRAIPPLAGNPYLLPGTGKTGHLVAITKAWHEIRKRAEIPDVRLHDLRRTVGSWLAQSGASLHLIGRVLNHSSTEATKVYARFGQNSVRTALEDHATQILEMSRYDSRNAPKLSEG